MGTELRSRSGAARLSLGLGLGILAGGEKKERRKRVRCGDGGRTKSSARPPTWLRESAGFLPLSLRVGSPVVLRGLCCHVCCDSALGFRKTFVPDCVDIPHPFQTLSGKIWEKKKRKKKEEKERETRQGRRIILCVSACRFVTCKSPCWCRLSFSSG